MRDATRLSARRPGALAFRRFAASFIFLALAAAPASAAEWYSKDELTAGNLALAKVSSQLLRARLLAAEQLESADIAAAVPVVELREGLLAVDVSLHRLDAQILAALGKRGMRVDTYDFDYARAYGWIAPGQLASVAAHAEVSTIYPMPRPIRRGGAVTSQGDATMNADDVRNNPELDQNGTGVTVGILSDTFNKTLGGTASGGTCTCDTPGSTCNNVVTGMTNQNSGDLPASIPVLDDCPGCGASGSDEGAALVELIFDSAPGANFLFHSAFNNPLDFANGIIELFNCGANVIVDDVGYTQEPFFQDGIIALAAQTAADAGAPYFSAAGNDATFGIDDLFVDSNPSSNNELIVPNGDDFHDFGSGDPFAAITIPDGCQIYTELQWNEPFDGAQGPGALTDLDLFLLDSPADPESTGDTNVLAASRSLQGCGAGGGSFGKPLEFLQHTNSTGSNQTVFLAVDHVCGNAVRMRAINLSFNCLTTSDFFDADPTTGFDFEDGVDIVNGAPAPDGGETPIFIDPQIWGHPAARDVVAVGAAWYAEIDGDDSGMFGPGAIIPPPVQFDVELFSSLGGDLPFFFDFAGAPLPGAPEIRTKPEITAPDGTNNTFFGSPDSLYDPDGFPEFFGTSAAAPHAAAVAALILEATDGKINPRPLYQLMQQAAFDIEAPGHDDLSGFGLADALAAIRSLDPDEPPLIDDLEFDLDGDAFFSSPPTGGTQRLQANDSLFLEDGDFSGVSGFADQIIFADGFESGDTSAWSTGSP